MSKKPRQSPSKSDTPLGLISKEWTTLASHRPVDLSKISTRPRSEHHPNVKYDELLKKNRTALEKYQVLLYAGNTQAMLIVFQGMDTAGKDGAIQHVMSGVNPQGCQVVSFQAPTSEELDHDFLWRVNCAMPARGKIGIFNRSYYEETLITRVHPKLLIDQKLPTGKKHGEAFWRHRFRDIVHHEKYLTRQGYEIVKIFIHISKKEQKLRLLARFNDPKKFWKISEDDVRERRFWKKYQFAHEECLKNTATSGCPWYVVPGDCKETARLLISQILVDRLKSMHLKFPQMSRARKQKIMKLKTEIL